MILKHVHVAFKYCNLYRKSEERTTKKTVFFNLTCNLSPRLEKLTAGGATFIPDFEKGESAKNECLGGGELIEFLPYDICLGGLTCFLPKKKKT